MDSLGTVLRLSFYRKPARQVGRSPGRSASRHGLEIHRTDTPFSPKDYIRRIEVLQERVPSKNRAPPLPDTALARERQTRRLVGGGSSKTTASALYLSVRTVRAISSACMAPRRSQGAPIFSDRHFRVRGLYEPR